MIPNPYYLSTLPTLDYFAIFFSEVILKIRLEMTNVKLVTFLRANTVLWINQYLNRFPLDVHSLMLLTGILADVKRF